MWRFLDPPRNAKIARFRGFWEKIGGLRRARGRDWGRLENFGSGQSRFRTEEMVVETSKKPGKV